MALWGRDGSSANAAPKYNIEAGTDETGVTSFSNTTVVDGRAVGTFPVDVAEMANTDMVTHPGWVVVRQYTGPVTGVTVTAGGTGYANTDLVNVSGGVANATGTISTNSTGGIQTVTLTSPGSGFIQVSNAVVAITNSTGGATLGTNATFTVALGGRAGRKCAETLVAMSSITSANDALFPTE